MTDNFLDTAAGKGLCYFAYRIPGSKAVYGGCRTHDCINGVGEGFVIKPFLPGTDAVTIPDLIADPEKEQYQHPVVKAKFPEYDTAHGFYIRHAGLIIDSLRGHIDRKVVYSRVSKHPFNRRLSEVFSELCDTYPQAYVFCFFTPATGTWIGASPELLARYNRGIFSTVALAGTMDAHEGGRWSEKNRREQQVVADFIRDTLHEAGLRDIKETEGQRMAGPVKHLLTEFQVNTPEDFDAGRLTMALSPTPAVAGVPRKEAIEIIINHESSPRGCYGGFCGPRAADDDFHFWVMLRCMQIQRDECALYIGGGLMPDSTPDAEWMETERKARTLKAVL